jgi:hypothetical protein
MKEGKLIHNGATNRMEIAWLDGGYSDGLNCGDVLEAYVDGQWLPIRTEYGDTANGPDWYFVGLSAEADSHWYDLPVRMGA